MKINNEELPYEYKGKATINRDIVEFSDGQYKYLYDIKINRLVKYDKKRELVLDFNQEEITIKEDKTITIKIKLINKKITSNKIYFKYKIDKNIIEFSLEIKEVKR